MNRLREIVRAVPVAELVEDIAGAILLLIIVLGMPRFIAVAAAVLEGAS